ncbi:uncharacterized protein [Euwallacea fornicatus]|uniref:uncharacterized protein n=1 Tax=Euwallacea fornicatus TaxID=995702 RepID=UPI00338DF7F6
MAFSEGDIERMLNKTRFSNLEKVPSKSINRGLETNVNLAENEELGVVKEGITPSKYEDEQHIFVEKQIPKSKMYTDFFKRKTTRAATWRALPPLSMEEMNLNQKADAITEKIATDFINWLRNLGGEEEVSLSVSTLIKMFEIQTNSASSLKANFKELPSVPRRVDEAQNEPEKAKRSLQHKEIMRGARANKKATTCTASRTRLSRDVSVRPSAETDHRKWIISDPTREKLASMAEVWQGITHLKSTIAFCKFLIEKPEIKPPKYLSDLGLLNWKTLREKEDGSPGDVS